MKKLIFIALLFTVGCKTPEYLIGMNETQFKQQNHSATLVAAETDVTVYRISRQKMMTWDDNTFYYYFKNNKLARIDQGVYRPNVLIEVKNSK
ncbi:MAG TPA: hypothetical protein VGI43_12690 [Mucilaginibacter sp.]